MQNKKSSGNVSGKGYYIALVLCAVAIGLTGFLYYRNAGAKDEILQNPTQQVVGTQPNSDVQAVATQPNEQPQSTQLPQKPSKVQAPVEGKTVVEYSMDALSYNQTTRDWRADGQVYTVYEDDAMGMTVVIRHEDGYTTKYACLAKDVSVKAGDTVTAGQKIGAVGDTALLESQIGNHLHFSVSCNGTVLDPAEFLS